MPSIPAAARRARLLALPAAFAAFLAFAPDPSLAQETACVPGRNLLADLSDVDRAAVEAEAAAVPNGEGRLFRIEREGTPASHLFGTMHLSDPRVLTLGAETEAAFETADRLVVETLDLADEAGVAAAVLSQPELTTLPPGTELLDLVAPERREDVAAALQARGMPADAVRSLQPWFVTVALVSPACEAERVAGGAQVLDLSLLRRAEADGKALSGLETAAEQLQALASLPLELQAENLAATVDLLGAMPDIFETMIVLYGEGRIAAITPAIENLAPSGTDTDAAAAVYAAFEERVVTRRNHVMAERLEPLLAEGGAFVAVGALHLPGEEGLVELLREDGWTVVRAD